MENLVQRARAAWEAKEWALTAELHEQAALGAPDDPRVGIWWYDAALAQKFLRNWPEAYRLGIFAAQHPTQPERDPAFWNLGIAATIQRDWATARSAWTGFGIKLPAGEGPIDGDFGRACVRLNCDEVVWVERLCPTRARVVNVPFDMSRRYGEIIVHDGEPKGDRVVDGRTYRVFDELVLFEPSPLPTLSVTVTAAKPADLAALHKAFDAERFGFEPLSNGHILCKCCSEGTVEQKRVRVSGEQQCLVAAPIDHARKILDAWSKPARRSWTDLHSAS